MSRREQELRNLCIQGTIKLKTCAQVSTLKHWGGGGGGCQGSVVVFSLWFTHHFTTFNDTPPFTVSNIC